MLTEFPLVSDINSYDNHFGQLSKITGSSYVVAIRISIHLRVRDSYVRALVCLKVEDRAAFEDRATFVVNTRSSIIVFICITG